MQNYDEELNNSKTNYFVIDSGSNVNHDDIQRPIGAQGGYRKTTTGYESPRGM